MMAIVAGLKTVGVFDILAQKLLMGTSGTVGVIRLLVLLYFFLSMVITNDVALITFAPLALIIVHKLPKELANYWLLKIVAMQKSLLISEACSHQSEIRRTFIYMPEQGCPRQN